MAAKISHKHQLEKLMFSFGEDRWAIKRMETEYDVRNMQDLVGIEFTNGLTWRGTLETLDEARPIARLLRISNGTNARR